MEIQPVIYPSKLKTNKDRLCALYPLIEQTRLWHNQEGDRFLSNPELEVKWNLFAHRQTRLGGNVFWRKAMPLFAERARLQDAVKKQHFPDNNEWKALTDTERMAWTVQYLGDRQAIADGIQLSDKIQASSVLFDQLKRVDLATLEGVLPPDPIEGFLGYTKVDSGSDLTVTDPKIAVAAMQDDEDSYVYYDYTASHFGDFEHLVSAYMNTKDANSNVGFWGVGVDIGPLRTFHVQGDGLVSFFGPHNADTVWFYLRDYDPFNSDTYFYGAGAATQFHFTIERNDTTATEKIYSPTRGTLKDTLSIVCVTTAHRYVYGVQSYGSGYGADTDTSTIDVENLDLQEAAPPAAFVGSRGFIIG